MAIDKTKIQAGDLLLFRIVKESGLLGKLIGIFSVMCGHGGNYNRMYGHVAICEDQNNYLEMTWPKSKRTSIEDAIKNPESEIWRITTITPEQIQKALDWGRGNLGKHYNIRHIITFGFIKGYGCADFVQNCLTQSGCPIILDQEGPDEPVVSPNEIADSKVTKCIDNNTHMPY